MSKIEEYGFAKEESRENIVANKHDHMTTTYYLILKKMIREGKESVADLVSKEFCEFISNAVNLLENKKVNVSIGVKLKEEKEKSVNSHRAEQNEEEAKVNILATNNQIIEKSKYLLNLPENKENNNTYNVHTDINNDLYVVTEAVNKVFINEKKKIIEAEQNEKILVTEQIVTNENRYNERKVIKEKIIDNYSNLSKLFFKIEKNAVKKFNYVNYFINTSTQYDKHSDLKNATFDEKLNKPSQNITKEKRFIPQNIKNNICQM